MAWTPSFAGNDRHRTLSYNDGTVTKEKSHQTGGFVVTSSTTMKLQQVPARRSSCRADYQRRNPPEPVEPIIMYHTPDRHDNHQQNSGCAHADNVIGSPIGKSPRTPQSAGARLVSRRNRQPVLHQAAVSPSSSSPGSNYLHTASPKQQQQQCSPKQQTPLPRLGDKGPYVLYRSLSSSSW